MSVSIKICGITTPAHARACADAGADYIGLVFYKGSPRAVTLKQAGTIAKTVQGKLKTVGLFVNPTLSEIATVLKAVPLDVIQLHGQESPAFVAQVKARFSLPVIKALPVAGASDLAAAKTYAPYVDWLLFDAKYKDGKAPGGHGKSFDWSLLEGVSVSCPWMLAGGLSVANVGKAIQSVRPDGVDVSSGVETAPGVKAAGKIAEFIACARESG